MCCSRAHKVTPGVVRGGVMYANLASDETYRGGKLELFAKMAKFPPDLARGVSGLKDPNNGPHVNIGRYDTMPIFYTSHKQTNNFQKTTDVGNIWR